MGKRARKAALFAMVSFFAMAGAAQAETRLSFVSGVEYSSGEYGGVEDTEVIAVPLGVRLTVNQWTFRASSAYLHVDGPADVSEDGEEGGSAFVRDHSDKGFGDTTISVERAFRRIGGSNTYVEASARARLPSGDDTRGLGTGTVDYGVNVEIGVEGRSGGVFTSAGYRFLGRRDEGPQRQDGAQAGVGGWLPVGSRGRVGAFANWREASVEGRDDPAQAGAYISYRMSERMRVTLTASSGLSDASPDYVAGIRFNWLPGGLNN